MSKKRRTKKQKFAAISRHTFQTVISGEKQEIRIEAQPNVKAQAKKETVVYSHVPADIRSTLIITAFLAAANIALFTLLKLKLINLFGIVF